jgi:succinate dehydrogenase / fumarate reductase cytochrome b subunit
MEKNYFLLRRLHSLTGIVPIGVFLIAHLTTNSSLLWGKWGLRSEGADETIISGGVHYFWKEVQWINNQIPHLLLIEIVLWVSIAFHSILGVYYARTGKANTARYAYQSNWRYSLQRITGYIAIFYIFYHIATLRWGWEFLVPGKTEWSADYAASTLARALRGSDAEYTAMGIVVSLFYFVGITASVYHFANGLWTAAITWGLTVSAPAQRRWGYVCAMVGVGLMGMAWMSLAGALITPPNEMREVEQRLLDKQKVKLPPQPGTIESRAEESLPMTTVSNQGVSSGQ